MKDILSTIMNEQVNSVESFQKLWGGYGQMCRFQTSDKSFVAKVIEFPQKQEGISHLRKVKSYEVETNWYQKYNNEIQNAYSPKLIKTGQIEQKQYLVLEDLANKSFIPKTEVSEAEVSLCLKWLAFFHAFYMNETPADLWEIGTYWHLETRPDELQAIDDLRLKEAAPLVDKRLNQAHFKTFVHGDAKLANFLFSTEGVAAVDFQYVGGGAGIKDVAYFLSSIYDSEQLAQNEKSCLNQYFSLLKEALSMYKPNIDFKSVEHEYRELYLYAWCDFYRFLKGWSPDHWKVHSYSEQITQRVLNEIIK